MTIELPYAGPNRLWVIEEGTVYPPKPKDWKTKRDGKYSEQGFVLALYDTEVERIDQYTINAHRGDPPTLIRSEEDAQEYLKNQGRWADRIRSHGPAMGVESTNKKVRHGGFLGMGGKVEVLVFQEEKVVGWNFVRRRPNDRKDLPQGFGAEDVLKAARKLLKRARNSDHVSALYENDKRHVGDYPPKTLTEEFPNAAS